jgi:hypothetical protein
VAVVDVDLGADNALFIRGDGAGLRWDRGQPLSCVGPRTWAWSPATSGDKLEFQLLLNDEVWARGDKVLLEPGKTIEITPDFEWPEIPKTSPHTQPTGGRPVCHIEDSRSGGLSTAPSA